ncbi:MAG: cell division protein FtsZ [Maricaulaceae bacterium]
MSISLSLPKSVELKPRIVVIGVGGAGGNAVNNMINSGLDGVEFIVANTDAQALSLSKADRRIQMGGTITEGLGAGMRPEVGEQSAEDSLEEILEHLDGAHMLFVAAGMGGGTGTGAAPVIAQAARERGILTVAIITKPFQFEGSRRMKLAEAGIEKLQGCVDTLITIPNQNLFRVATEQTTMSDAFAMADEVLHSGVRGITDLMVVPGLINLDFNDVRTVMDEMGKAMMGTGEATGERRAIEAAESAVSNPLLDDVSLKGARGVLINITGGGDLTLYEVDEAASLIRGQVDEDANIIVGSALDPDLDGIVRVSVVATGVGSDGVRKAPPARRSPAREEIAPAAFVAAEAPATEEKRPHIEGITDQHTVKPVESMPTLPPMPVAAERPVMPRPAAAHASAALQPQETPRPQMPVKPQNVVRNTFGIFGRRKKAAPIPAPVERRAPPVAPRPSLNQTGELFGDNMENELEIPAFLRRQNR